jgi:type I restriction enzyme, S subunit
MKTGEAFMTGSAGQKRVPTSFIENFLVALPPLSEQRQIAHFLDHKTAQIDAAIEKGRCLIELLREERAALINEAVTAGVDEHGRPRTKPTQLPAEGWKDSGVEWLGAVPKEWEVVKLKYLTNLKSGDSITSESIETEGLYPVFGGNGIRGYYNQFNHEGDYVLIGRQGAQCGNINYASGRFFASEHAVVATMKKEYLVKWLGELLTTMNLNQYSVSAAQPGLSVDRIQNLFIPVPSFSEQDLIVHYIETETTRIDQEISILEREIELLAEYRQALISEAVTGKIDVRDIMVDGER